MSPRISTTLAALAMAVLLALAPGCTDVGGIRLESSDQIAQPGQTIMVQASIIRSGWSAWFPQNNPPTLRLYRNSERLDEFQPGGSNWSFTAPVRLEDVGKEVAIQAIYQRRQDNKPEQATCHAYCWDASRVAVVVDFDRVLNVTSKQDKFFHDRPLGEIRPQAAEVLAFLARQFYVCYVTELGAELKEQIRGWMVTNNIPVGPIFTWDRGRSFQGVVVQPGNQAAVLGDLQRKLPTLLIGIGGGPDDLAAFGQNRMLGVMIDFGQPLPGARWGRPEFADWAEAYRLFDEPANQRILADPAHMLDLRLRGGQYIDPNGASRATTGPGG